MDLYQCSGKRRRQEYTSWTLVATEEGHIFLQENTAQFYDAEVEVLIHATHILTPKITVRISSSWQMLPVTHVVLQWIAAHCVIPENENRLAKLGAVIEQKDN